MPDQLKPRRAYSYCESVKGFELHVGCCSTKKALMLFEPATKFELERIGATLYQHHGWATKENFPTFATVGSFLSFLDAEGDIGIGELYAQLADIGSLEIDTDDTCRFVFMHRKDCLRVLRSLLPFQHRDNFINKLLKNPGLYLCCRKDGSIATYSCCSAL